MPVRTIQRKSSSRTFVAVLFPDIARSVRTSSNNVDCFEPLNRLSSSIPKTSVTLDSVWDMRLLTATYKRGQGESITVELYGKTREGKSAVARYSSFRPYFQFLGDIDKVRRALSTRNDVVDIREAEFFSAGEQVRGGIVTVKFPWTVPDFRSMLRDVVDVRGEVHSVRWK